MPNWQRHLRLGDKWQAAKARTITPSELALVVAERLERLRPFGGDFEPIDDERADLIEQFKDVAANPGADFDDFDYVLEQLYDWGDQRMDGDWNGKKVCWVDTFVRETA